MLSDEIFLSSASILIVSFSSFFSFCFFEDFLSFFDLLDFSDLALSSILEGAIEVAISTSSASSSYFISRTGRLSFTHKGYKIN